MQTIIPKILQTTVVNTSFKEKTELNANSEKYTFDKYISSSSSGTKFEENIENPTTGKYFLEENRTTLFPGSEPLSNISGS